MYTKPRRTRRLIEISEAIVINTVTVINIKTWTRYAYFIEGSKLSALKIEVDRK